MRHANRLFLAIVFFGFLASVVSAQTTAFTYQGSLKDGSSPANGNYDFEFKLFDQATGGTQQGSGQQNFNVVVGAGFFTVTLDFGLAALPGANRYLEISVRPAGGGAFTPLGPRQLLNSTPYSVRSLNSANADSATNAAQLGGVAASQYVVTTDPRMTDERAPTAGSSDYVQNTGTVQPGVNFNIGGTGTAGILNAETQFNLAGSRILSAPGTNNLFAGVNAGTANTTGGSNSFFGSSAGQSNTGGSNNAFFGREAGKANTTGFQNSFYGTQAGLNNSTGSFNSFFGRSVGLNNTNGGGNSFFGQDSGIANTIGSSNSFFGNSSGGGNTTGGGNSFFGANAGVSNTTGGSLTIIGAGANVGFNNLSFASAFGAGATVNSNNTVVLGRTADTVMIPGAFRANGAGASTLYGNAVGNENGAYLAFEDSAGTAIGYVGDGGSGDSDVFLTSYLANASLITPAGRVLTATANGNVTMTGGPILQGPTVDFYAAQTIDNGTHRALFTPHLFVASIDTFLASPVHLCVRSQSIGGSGGYTLVRCTTTFSSSRDKSDVQPYTGGLDTVRKMNPIRFTRKDTGAADVGLNSDEIAASDPLLVTRDEKGAIDGVNESGLQTVLISAVKEQQSQIEAQKKQIESFEKQNQVLQMQIEALTQALCSLTSDAEVCKKKEQ